MPWVGGGARGMGKIAQSRGEGIDMARATYLFTREYDSSGLVIRLLQ